MELNRYARCILFHTAPIGSDGMVCKSMGKTKTDILRTFHSGLYLSHHSVN